MATVSKRTAAEKETGMNRLRYRLSFRQARDAVVIAFVLGLIFSLVQIAADLDSEREAVDRTVNQVLNTLQAPAVQAAYHVDRNLANNVVYSLFEYRPIYSATLVDDFGDSLAHLQRPVTRGWLSTLADAMLAEHESYTLPLVNERTGKSLGELRVRVDGALIIDNFLRRSILIIVFGFLRTLILAGILVYVFYVTLTKPLTALTRRISAADPTDVAAAPLTVGKRHDDDELGQLAASVNAFATLTKEHLSQRQQAEQALRESEERFRSIIDNSPSFISLKDADGRYQLVNRKHVEMFGIEPSDVVGKTNFDFAPEKQATEATAHDRKVIETKSAITEERRLSIKQGTRDFLVTKFPVLDGSGDVVRIGTIGTDTTERKRAAEALKAIQARLANILDNSPSPIYFKDTKGGSSSRTSSTRRCTT